MQLKSRHLILFVIACALLIFADLSGGALLGLAAALQLALLIHEVPLTRQAQVVALKLFLVSIPLVFFWGGVHSFVGIYFQERQILYFLMALIISAGLTTLAALQMIFSYYFLEQGQLQLFTVLNESFNHIRIRRREFMQITLVLFVFSFVPWLTADWKLVFAITATHLYLNRSRLKLALARF